MTCIKLSHCFKAFLLFIFLSGRFRQVSLNNYSEKGNRFALCTLCNLSLSITDVGKSDITRHAQGSAQIPDANISKTMLNIASLFEVTASDAEVLISAISHSYMDESSKFPKSGTFETPILKLAVCPLNVLISKFKWSVVFRRTVYN